MQSCCILECDSYKSIINKKVSYFKFPIDKEELHDKWIEAIGRLPNWTPNSNTQICENHFKVTDIVRPYNKYPYLKPNTLPSIFPKKRFQPSLVENKNHQAKVKPVVKRNVKTEVIAPVLQATPVIVAPNIIDQLSTVNQIPALNSPSRYRKILPKVSNSTEIQQNQSGQKENLSSSQNVTPNPYIIIIPTFSNSKSLSPSLPKIPIPSNKKPILKITVGRKLREDEYSSTSKQNNDQVDHNSHKDEDKRKLYKDMKDKNEEIVVNNYSMNKSVVFSLDPVSGNIKVSHRPLNKSSSALVSKQSDSGSECRRITRSSVKESKTSTDLISNLKESYLKPQEDYNGEKTSLMLLNPVNKYKSEEIDRLEEELLKYGNSINSDNKSFNKPPEKRKLSYTSEDDSSDSIFLFDNLIKNSEITIKKVKTSSITNGQLLGAKSLSNKKLNNSHNQILDKKNNLFKFNSMNMNLRVSSD